MSSSHKLQWVMLAEEVHAFQVDYRLTAKDVSVIELLAPTESLCKVPTPVVSSNLCNNFSITGW